MSAFADNPKCVVRRGSEEVTTLLQPCQCGVGENGMWTHRLFSTAQPGGPRRPGIGPKIDSVDRVRFSRNPRTPNSRPVAPRTPRHTP